MPIELTCPQGHVLYLTEQFQDKIMLCPVCREEVQLPSDWSQLEDTAQTDSVDAHPTAEANLESSTDSVDTAGKGLWQLMAQPDSNVPTEADSDSDSSSTTEYHAADAAASHGEVDSTDKSNSPKGLWSVMNESVATGESAQESNADVTDPSSSMAHDVNPQPTDVDTPSSEVETDESPKGLWSVMSSDSNAVDSPSTESPDAAISQPTRRWASVTDDLNSQDVPARDSRLDVSSSSNPENSGGLWATTASPSGGRAEGLSTEADTITPIEMNEIKAVGSQIGDQLISDSLTAPEPVISESVDSTDETADDSVVSQVPARTFATLATRRCRNGLISAVMGWSAIPLAMFTYFEVIWAKLPSTATGMLGIVLGMMAISEIKRSNGRQTGMGLAVCGMTFGVMGMFLGPIFVGPWGIAHRERAGQAQARESLTKIGEALEKYHQQDSHYPPGGVFRKDGNGFDVPMHGWMTLLLPYLDEQELADRIDRNQRYNAPPNLSAMQTELPLFLVDGVAQRRTVSGLAVAHFAGVGGEIVRQESGFAHVGIFERNSIVSQSDITDGLSTTFVAGQIADNFPAWGDPKNFRAIAKEGLNSHPWGFGNSKRTGALFLMADGSVRFFPNSTSTRVLEMLSTRDGQENVRIEDD